MERIKWTARRFEFNFPVEIHPELLERLRGTPARVADRLADVPQERLIRRPGRGWSLQEHGGHLADLDENLFLPRLDEYAAKVTTLRAADMSNRRTEAANHNAQVARRACWGTLRRARAGDRVAHRIARGRGVRRGRLSSRASTCPCGWWT